MDTHSRIPGVARISNIESHIFSVERQKSSVHISISSIEQKLDRVSTLGVAAAVL